MHKYMPYLIVFYTVTVLTLATIYSGGPNEQGGLWALQLLNILLFPTSLLFPFMIATSFIEGVFMLGLVHFMILGGLYSFVKKILKHMSHQSSKQRDDEHSKTFMRCTYCGAIALQNRKDLPQIQHCPQCKKRYQDNTLNEVQKENFKIIKTQKPVKVQKDNKRRKVSIVPTRLDPGQRSRIKKNYFQKHTWPGTKPVISPQKQTNKTFRQLLCEYRKGFLITGIIFALPAFICAVVILVVSLDAGYLYLDTYYEKVSEKGKWVQGKAYIKKVSVSYDRTSEMYYPYVYIQYAVKGKIINKKLQPPDLPERYSLRWKALNDMSSYKSGKLLKIYYVENNPNKFMLWEPEPPPIDTKTTILISPVLMFACFFFISFCFCCLGLWGYHSARGIKKIDTGILKPSINMKIWYNLKKISIAEYSIIFLLISVVFFSLLFSNINNKPFILHRAVQKGHIEDIKKLVQQGININRKDSSGFSPLHLAAMAGNSEIIKILVQNGAYINLRDNLNRTPLDLAENESTRMTIRYNGGKTALELTKN